MARLLVPQQQTLCLLTAISWQCNTYEGHHLLWLVFAFLSLTQAGCLRHAVGKPPTSMSGEHCARQIPKKFFLPSFLPFFLSCKKRKKEIHSSVILAELLGHQYRVLICAMAVSECNGGQLYTMGCQRERRSEPEVHILRRPKLPTFFGCFGKEKNTHI